jgi:hypothetical protein
MASILKSSDLPRSEPLRVLLLLEQEELGRRTAGDSSKGQSQISTTFVAHKLAVDDRRMERTLSTASPPAELMEPSPGAVEVPEAAQTSRRCARPA